jgi:hypothetical protein
MASPTAAKSFVSHQAASSFRTDQMSPIERTAISPADLYVRIAGAVVADPSMVTALLGDFEGTVAERIGVVLPKRASLTRVGSGFRLTYDGQDYDLGDPRNAIKGELNDAELELVSAGGGDDCAYFKKTADGLGDTIKDAFTGNTPPTEVNG